VRDDPTTASRWLSATAASLVDHFTTRLAQEDTIMVSAAQARPRPLFLQRAVGLIRVSEVGGREGEKFVSPREQRALIDRHCEREEMRLVAVFEEMDISGYRRGLDRRPGLGPAVEMIERRQAEVVVVAYFDRLFRRMSVKEEVLRRVEAAGGSLLAIDVGEVREDTASRWLTTSMLTMVAEYHARLTAEKTYEAKVEAVAAGIPPWAILPLGYVRGADRRIYVDPTAADVAREAFERREAGASLYDIGVFLRERGYSRSFRSIQKMFYNRFYLGELHFGKLVNPRSHEAIIDPRLFRSVSHMRGDARGPQTDSPNLLARQGLLYCGTCGAKMVAGGQNLRNRPDAPHTRYYDYRCASIVSPSCSRRPYISAVNLDAYVVEYVKRRLADAQGRWSSDERLVQAQAELIDKEQRLNGAVAAFDGLGDVAAIQAKLREMKVDYEAARERLEELRAAFGTPAVASMADWADMTLTEQRSLLRAFIKRIVIVPGRGTLAQRVTIEPFEE
jgi:DNA invertase Pin-like site-specific DNA recombinase